MTTDSIPIVRRRAQRGLLYTAGLAAVWLVAAAVRPEVTYHLAPMLVAGALPIAMSLESGGSARARVLALAAAAGFLVAGVMAAMLAVAGWLEGPALGPFSSALGESIAGATFGAAGGFLVATLWRR